MENMKFKGKTIKEPKKEPEYKNPTGPEQMAIGEWCKGAKTGTMYRKVKYDGTGETYLYSENDGYLYGAGGSVGYLSATPPHSELRRQ